MKKIYIASPFGFAESTLDFHKSKIIPAVAGRGVEVLDPWTLPPSPPFPSASVEEWRDFCAAKGAANLQAIDGSDGVFAVLDGVDVDSGTASEIGYAFAKGKRIVGYRNDFRRTGDTMASIVNLQVEFFIKKSGGDIIQRVDLIDSAVAKLLD